MSEYDHPVYERPEDGRVLNPATENWVKQSYAKKIGILQDAKQKTAEFYRQKEKEGLKAAEKAIGRINDAENDSQEDKETLNAQKVEDNEDQEQLDETARVEYDESGQEHRVDHGDSGGEKSPDEALESIMNDIDSGEEFEGDEFVDTDAVDPSDAVDPTADPSTPSGEEVEDYEPENVEMPTFPGGVYSTKARAEKKKKKQIEEMSEGDDPRERGDTSEAGKNKRYEHTESGGIRVIYEDNEDDNEEN